MPCDWRQNKHPFNSLFSTTTWLSQYQKGKIIQDFNHTNTLSLNFYGPLASDDIQPTVTKH